MTEDCHLRWLSKPLCTCLYLGLNTGPLLSSTSVSHKVTVAYKFPLILVFATNFEEFNMDENIIRDARTPQPWEMFFNTMRYRSSETVQRLEYFQSSVSYIKLQIMFK